MMPVGSLEIVGTGIQVVQHTTLEARMSISQADKVLYLVTDPTTEKWIEKLNPNSESLLSFYEDNKPRIKSYQEMVEHILKFVRDGLRVCAVFYGHPGVFVFPGHEAIRQARHEGFDAHMLPGISAEDCLFADLDIDPARGGCQSFEATDFLVYKRRFDPTSSLILWQVGVIGDLTFKKKVMYKQDGLYLLVDVLARYYGLEHEVVIYVASEYPFCRPLVQRVALKNLAKSNLSPVSTLYVPPKKGKVDEGILKELNLDQTQILNTQGCWEQIKDLIK